MNIVWRRCDVSAILELSTNDLLFTHTGFSLVQKLVTLDDLERYNVIRYNELFHKIRQHMGQLRHIGRSQTQTVTKMCSPKNLLFDILRYVTYLKCWLQ